MITILVATYNDVELLKFSVNELLDHLSSKCHLLIVDDGNAVPVTQAFPEAAMNQFVRILRNDSNLGLTASLNRGMSTIEKGLILRLDAGDEIIPAAIPRLMLASQKLPAISFMQASVVDELGNEITLKPKARSLCKWDFVLSNPVVHGSVVLNRDRWDLVWPPYARNALVAQDFELWLRVAVTRAHIDVLPFLGYRYWKTDGISSRQAAQQAATCIRAFRTLFLRKPLLSLLGQIFWFLMLLYRQIRSPYRQ